MPITLDGSTVSGVPQQIVDRQKFVGEEWLLDDNDFWVVYGYYGTGTRYKAALTLPFQTDMTQPHGYNKHREVVGYFHDFEGHVPVVGFVVKKGIVSQVQYPADELLATYLEGVNDSGEIVGGWKTQSAWGVFYYNLQDNSFDVIGVPSKAYARAFAINNYGVATIYADSGSYIYCRHAKHCPSSPNAIEVKERHVAGGPLRSVVCEHECIGPLPRSKHAALTGDELKRLSAAKAELQRETVLPFRK